jgi:hypothetical protein
MAAIALIAWSGLLALPVAAKCNPALVDPQERDDSSEHYNWDGTKQGTGGPTLTSVESNITNYSPFVPQGKFSYAWIMMTRGASWSWAQIGPHEVYNSRDMHIQTANGTSSSVWDMDTAAQTLGTLSDLKMLYTANNGNFIFTRNGVQLLSKHLDWVPNDAQFYSEIPSYNTQLMGATNSVVHFRYNRIGYSGNTHSVSVAPSSTDGWFMYGGTGYDFYTWDSACQN